MTPDGDLPGAAPAGQPAWELDPRNSATWPELLTPEELAVVLRMHIEVVRRLLREGKLPGRRLGRSWYTEKAELLLHQRTPPQP